MHPRCGDHLVGDGQQGIELVLAGHIEVGLDLGRDQLVPSGLDLDKRGPGAYIGRLWGFPPVGVVSASRLGRGSAGLWHGLTGGVGIRGGELGADGRNLCRT
jgi:hypothetical protein